MCRWPRHHPLADGRPYIVTEHLDGRADDRETQLLETTTRVALIRRPGALRQRGFTYDLDLETEPVIGVPALVRIR